jgi:hypothetical protein
MWNNLSDPCIKPEQCAESMLQYPSTGRPLFMLVAFYLVDRTKCVAVYSRAYTDDLHLSDALLKLLPNDLAHTTPTLADRS